MDTIDVGLLTLMSIVIGWVVVNHQHNRREDRKEFRALSDRAKALTASIAKDAMAFHCEGKTDLTAQIKWDLDALELELTLFPNYSVRDGPLLSCYVAFADAVMGGDFEAAEPSKVDRNAPIVLAILRTRNALIGEIEHQFRAYFR